MTTILLDDLRDAPIASLKFCLYGENMVTYVDGLYDQYAIIALEETIARLQELENMKKSSGLSSTKHITTISLWFLAIDTFVSNMLNIFSYYTKTPVKNKLKLYQKINCILELGKFPRKDFYQSGYFQKLQEFTRLRNVLFHGSYHNTSLDFSKTIFSNNPLKSNIIDSLQACIIALETFQIFGSIMANHWLMPHYPIKNSCAIAFLREDVIYNEYLVPYFKALLKKHNLSTKLQTSLIKYKLPVSEVLLDKKINILIYAKPTKDIPLAQSETQMNVHFYKSLFKYLPQEDMVILPKYNTK